jgi:hypothetical protein
VTSKKETIEEVKKTEIHKEKVIEPKKQESPKAKTEQPDNETREISEEELKKILGI